MARYNEILVARYNRYLQKLLGFKGGPPAAQLSSEIMPTLGIHRPGSRENYYLEGWDTFWFTRAAVSVGGITNVQRLRNPAGSKVIAIFEQITYMNFNV